MSEAIHYEDVKDDIANNTVETIIRDEEKSLPPSPDFDRLDESKPTVYLAGGFYGDWNKLVTESIESSANVLDPRSWQGVTDYVSTDLDAIDAADIVFAYRQRENPAIGMCAEIGYAFGRGKHIIFIGEYETSRMERYYHFVRAMADNVLDSVEEGIEDIQEVIHEWTMANTN